MILRQRAQALPAGVAPAAFRQCRCCKKSREANIPLHALRGSVRWCEGEDFDVAVAEEVLMLVIFDVLWFEDEEREEINFLNLLVIPKNPPDLRNWFGYCSK
ncbi:unnamed protein product [Vicia faba]|uniref:Uncharacterized protein n=1 Tax=Vicia faba TaxID=3906 RepID=A0AAV0ZIV4_VICFA|nr:unnamed protein product [Vicia faba]